MTPESFSYWLQGFVELSDTDTISEKQWLMIKDHLKLVFDKKTPYRGDKDFGHLFDRPKPVDLIGKQFDWVTSPSYHLLIILVKRATRFIHYKRCLVLSMYDADSSRPIQLGYQ